MWPGTRLRGLEGREPCKQVKWKGFEALPVPFTKNAKG